MRALEPDRAELVTSPDGVRIHVEVFGDGEPAVLLVPAAPITHSRMYKALVPHLARTRRVVTMDGRGNGRSDRPVSTVAHRRAANEADILAVLDACGVGRAVLVGHCHANWWTVDVATDHPDRVAALVALSPGVPHVGPSQPHWVEMAPRWDEVIDGPVAWELATRAGMVDHHRRWIEFFFDRQLVEAHSTKQYEDMVGWALESSGEVLAAAEEGIELDAPDETAFRDRCRRLDQPVLVIHGDRDVCQSVERGRAFAELVGGELVVVEGAGHLVPAREPVVVNRAIRDFLDRRAPAQPVAARPPRRTWRRAANRPRRVLYLSSPIGLGHARRDVAIARRLLDTVEGLEVDWLAQDPVTRVLAEEGMRVHPASAWLASESAHLASEASGHRLDCFEALRRMDEILVANFMVFQQVVEETDYDVVVGDEAWDVDHHWHENPELKRGAHVWLTDFVGHLPMPSGGDHAAFLTADHNAEMLSRVERFPRVRDRALFVGNPADVVDTTFGPGLPGIGDWTRDHFDFTGYVTGFPPPGPDDIARWRHEFGWDDAPIVVAAVGGSGVGGTLLGRVVEAFTLARRRVDDLRMVAVTGPRIDPSSLPGRPGLEVRGYVERLYRQLAACDLAVVQGGLTTTMELAAARRPFLYFPLRDHFEQNIHVRHRLDNYRAGRCMDFATSDPDTIAAAMVAELGTQPDFRPVETDGAERAAALVRELL